MKQLELNDLNKVKGASGGAVISPELPPKETSKKSSIDGSYKPVPLKAETETPDEG